MTSFCLIDTEGGVLLDVNQTLNKYRNFKRIETSHNSFVQLVEHNNAVVALDNFGKTWICNISKTNPQFVQYECCDDARDKRFIFISSGGDYIVALDSNNNLWCIGSEFNNSNEIYKPRSKIDKFTKLKFPNKVVQVACGSSHTILVDEIGIVWSRGSNKFGQLGLGHNENKKDFEQVLINSFEKFVQISCGQHHSMMVDQSGFIWSCGLGFNGILGSGHTNNQNTFEKISSFYGEVPTDLFFMYISCGSRHTVALDNHNNLWSCGNNFHGQLGVGDNQNRSKFKQMPVEGEFEQIYCCENATFALDKDKTLHYCGNGENILTAHNFGSLTIRSLPNHLFVKKMMKSSRSIV